MQTCNFDLFFLRTWRNKTYLLTNLRMLFSNMDFNFAYFANFNFPHFEIEEHFWLI